MFLIIEIYPIKIENGELKKLSMNLGGELS